MKRSFARTGIELGASCQVNKPSALKKKVPHDLTHVKYTTLISKENMMMMAAIPKRLGNGEWGRGSLIEKH